MKKKKKKIDEQKRTKSNTQTNRRPKPNKNNSLSKKRNDALKVSKKSLRVSREQKYDPRMSFDLKQYLRVGSRQMELIGMESFRDFRKSLSQNLEEEGVALPLKKIEIR
eukprot:Anaeramoba_flamelloidesa2426_11.p1 GENE.a2426_11~~a2426_11.p1  ORF type:complete len:121 (+),score=36.12 a2426_11:39-365(+)